MSLSGLLVLSLAVGASQAPSPRVIHVIVALADNATQGIVPVPARLGNGDDPANNLYWGARYGVKTFLRRGPDWELVATLPGPAPEVLERVVFRHRRHAAFLVTDAYRGAAIRRALGDFLDAAAGRRVERLAAVPREVPELGVAGGAELIGWVGHDALMDFELAAPPANGDGRERPGVVLACASKEYFAAPLRAAGARPLLWTTGLLAPEAYVLAAVLEGFLLGEEGEPIRERAAVAYDRYQHCGLAPARRLFAVGF